MKEGRNKYCRRGKACTRKIERKNGRRKKGGFGCVFMAFQPRKVI